MEDNQLKARRTAVKLMAGEKGLLAMDESYPTCNERFEQIGIPQTAENRRDYRELLITAPGLSKYISGAILYDETIRQQTSNGRSFIEVLVKSGIIPGIKVDMGTARFSGYPGEKITEGLEGLQERLKEYSGKGLLFAKWRAVFAIGDDMPSDECIKENIDYLTKYAELCQIEGLTPILEPEVLMDGSHSILHCAETSEKVLVALFKELKKQNVDLKGILLKTNMVLPGKDATEQSSLEEVADATINCLLKCVPSTLAGIVFLSGGQTSELASARLNEMNKPSRPKLPWPLTFSFSRALQYPAIEIWKGDEKNITEAQAALCFRAKCNSEARQGIYNADEERR